MAISRHHERYWRDVSTICIGMAASMGAFLRSSGAAGKRYACCRTLEIMIHFSRPPARRVRSRTWRFTSKRLEIIKERMTRILAENTGKSVETVHG